MTKVPRVFKTLFALTCAIMLFGCGAILPSETEIMAAGDFGPKPTVAQADALIKEYLNQTLFDPYSAQYGGDSHREALGRRRIAASQIE